MKILQINTVYGKGSTGKIALGIHDCCKQQGHECISAYRYAEPKDGAFPDTITTSTWLDCHIHNRIVRYTNMQGCFSHICTARFLSKLSVYKPDVIHLHNLHGSFLNIPMLFRYIKKHRIPVVWTLHDCWAFTGHCPHFVMDRCDKWKEGCRHCPRIRSYPRLSLDLSSFMWTLKRKCFTGVENLTLVTPSEWLAGLVKQSFLKDYPVTVINNGIDLNIFRPVESSFRRDHGIGPHEYMLLGVAFGWGEQKGLDVFIRLARQLPEKYRIVLVGTDETVDKKLPENIISIHRTGSQQELAEIYSAADLFVNPTREDTYPTVNMEALACGTPVITFNTGGSPEIIDGSCGCVVDCDDVEGMMETIVCLGENKLSFSSSACLLRASGLSNAKCYKKYLDLYNSVSKDKIVDFPD